MLSTCTIQTHSPSFFLSQLHSNALLLPSASSTLLSVFPSPYINPSEGEVSQAPDKKNIPPNEDLWNGNLANPSEWVCLRGSWMKAFPPRAFSDPQYTLITPHHKSTQQNTG